MSPRNVRPFVHLRVLSSYSLGLGLSSPGEICRHARRVGFDSVALTDVSGTYGFVEFHRAAREVGVKPIYGTIVFVDWRNPPDPDDPPHWLTLLALDRAGLRHVCAAATLSAVRRERGEGVFVADLEDLAEGVVAIAGVDPRTAEPSPRHLLLPLRDLFHDRLFVEYRGGLAGERAARQYRVLSDARSLEVPPVLVQDVRFVGPSRPQLADLAATADETGFEHRVFGDARFGPPHGEAGMLTAAEMSSWFDHGPEAYSNASLIAALVQPDLLEIIEEERASAKDAETLAPAPAAHTALRTRVDAAFAKTAAAMDVADRQRLRGILDRELEAIAGAELEAAFVSFEEIARAARAAGVTLGPATGLAFQSMCAFLLGITSFDPYAVWDGFQPNFADATGEGCVFDLQVVPQERPRLLAVLNRVFDHASIGYVPSVEHITAARALRTMAKRLGVDSAEFEEAVRVAGRHQGASLRELAEENKAIGAMYRKSAVFRDLVSHAAAIEGLPFGFARTKRTLVVSPRPLRDFLGHTVSPETGEHFVQSTPDSFPAGAVRRIDVTTLNVLAALGDGAVAWRLPGEGVYRLIADDDLDGVHILEGAPRRLAREFGIESFADLTAFVTLLRDRGSDMSLGDRLAAYRGEPRPVPAAGGVADVLASTHGWLLYRDQVRDLVARLTGLAPEEAARLAWRFRDHAPGNLAALRREFLALTVERSIPFEDATAWFTRIVHQAKHVADRQRIVAECLIVARCLELKSEDRLLFMAGLLNRATDDEKRTRYREVLDGEGHWLAPDVHTSGRWFRVEGKGIRAPLWTIPGVSREVSDSIIRMREAGRVSTYDDFICAAGEAGITLQEIDALVRAGAIEASAGRDLKSGRPSRAKASAAAPSQLGLSLGGSPVAVPSAAPSPSPSSERVDKDGNTQPAFRVVPSLLEFYPHPIASPVELAGRIRNLHEFRSSSGKSVGFFELFDSSGSVRVFVPWERVARIGEPLSDGSHVIVQGKVRLRDGRKVCDALEIVVTVGGNGHGETSPDNPAKGDP